MKINIVPSPNAVPMSLAAACEIFLGMTEEELISDIKTHGIDYLLEQAKQRS